MAQLLQCDRCEKTEPGAFTQRDTLMGMQSGYTPPSEPNVPGWRTCRASLLCPSCSKQLDDWLKPLPKAAPQ